jgi:hypothetical protein
LIGQEELFQRRIKCVALWLIAHDGKKLKVLLQKHNELMRGPGSKLYTPLFTNSWFRRLDERSTLSIIREEAGNLLGELFVQNHLTREGYPFPNLLLVDNKEFQLKGERRAVRSHYFGKITENQLKKIENRLHHLLWETPFPHTKRIITKTITADDCCRIFERGSIGRVRNGDIILFPDDFSVIFPLLENDAAEMRLILQHGWP